MSTSRRALGWTTFLAASKSAFVSRSWSITSFGISLSISIKGMIFRIAFIAASFTRSAISAPTNPNVVSASSSRSTSFASGTPRVWTWKISYLPFLSGIPISISRSKRPPRRSAGSMEFGRFVAAITMTCPRPASPSIRASIWATIRRSTSPCTSSRFGAIASISSMKMMDGAFSSASWNLSRRAFSLSP